MNIFFSSLIALIISYFVSHALYNEVHPVAGVTFAVLALASVVYVAYKRVDKAARKHDYYTGL